MISAVILAAGRGRRFGYAPKMLAPAAGVPLVDHALAAVGAGPVSPVVLVTGRRAAAIARRGRRIVRPRAQLRVIHNAHPERGMAGSLRLGIDALPARCDAALICLADMPLVEARQLAALCRAWRPGLDYVRPFCGEHPGHPVLVSRALFGALRGLSGDRGAQHLLSQVPPEYRRHVRGSRAAVADTDTPRALRQLRPALRRRTQRSSDLDKHCANCVVSNRTLVRPTEHSTQCRF